MKLIEHHALIFDVYGTLVDWESAIHDAFAPVFPNLTREEILTNYAGVEGKLQAQFQSTPYATLLELAYRQLTNPLDATTVDGVEERLAEPTSDAGGKGTTADAARRFGGSIPDWKPFPDTVDALHRLKKHFALIVLSNVDDESFSGTHNMLCSPSYPGSAFSTITPDSPFSLVLTAQQVGAYKPDPMMLQTALRQLSAQPDALLPSNGLVRVDGSHVLVVANSLRHDIIPATQNGLRSVWISRYGANVIGNERDLGVRHSEEEGATTEGRCIYGWRYETLGRMADAVEREGGVTKAT